MLFAVVFTDRSGQGALRAAHLQAHINWVAAHQAHVHQLIQTDPFWTCGLRQSAEVLHWSKALDQQVLV
jgi:uncharacterized protein YciI